MEAQDFVKVRCAVCFEPYEVPRHLVGNVVPDTLVGLCDVCEESVGEDEGTVWWDDEDDLLSDGDD